MASQMVGTGDICISLTGRRMAPVPKVDNSTNRKCTMTENRINQWLIDEATSEALGRNDDYNLLFFEDMDIKNLPQASKDHLNLYLFGEC